MKKKTTPFKDLSNTAIGIGVVGIATGVGAKAASYAPAGSPNLTSGFGTIASFTGIAATARGGKTVLKELKNLK